MRPSVGMQVNADCDEMLRMPSARLFSLNFSWKFVRFLMRKLF